MAASLRTGPARGVRAIGPSINAMSAAETCSQFPSRLRGGLAVGPWTAPGPPPAPPASGRGVGLSPPDSSRLPSSPLHDSLYWRFARKRAHARRPQDVAARSPQDLQALRIPVG